MDSVRRYSVGEVFVPGGRPTVTYNPRDDLKLEEQVRRYLQNRHSILSVSGPTKSGKTVLLKSIVRQGLWISGGSTETVEDFWQVLGDQLDLATEFEDSEAQSQAQRNGWNTGVGVGPFKAEFQHGDEAAGQSGRRATRVKSMKNRVREVILDNGKPVIIDDFHYVPPETQLQITRGIKDLVFDGLPVVVASVPHRAFDVVRVEKEMTGRVDQLEVGFWSAEDLAAIATRGFAALRVTDPEGKITSRLVRESFQSPHLMQLFCREVCHANGIEYVLDEERALEAPAWEPFFRAKASDTSKSAFELLARGPRQRTDRIARRLVTGEETDIYGAILAAIAHTGPLTKITYEQLRAALREVLESEVPQRHEITRVLDEMTKIAKNHIDGEPVVDYDAEYGTLYISDPFFAYYLRWGVRPDVEG